MESSGDMLLFGGVASNEGQGDNVDPDEAISEDESVHQSDIDMYDDREAEEGLDHANFNRQKNKKRDHDEDSRLKAVATAYEEKYAGGYSEDESSDEGRPGRRFKRLRRNSSGSEDESQESETSQHAAENSDLDNDNENNSADFPEAFVSGDAEEVLPLKLPMYLHTGQEQDSLIYAPEFICERFIDEHFPNSLKIGIAFGTKKFKFPVDFESIDDQEWVIFQTIFIILYAAGEAEVNGAALFTAFWPLGKRNFKKQRNMADVLDSMIGHYTEAYMLFRVIFHTSEAIEAFSAILSNYKNLLDPRDNRIGGSAPVVLLKKHLTTVPGITQKKRKKLLARIFTQGHHLSRGIVLLAQTMGTTKTGVSGDEWRKSAAVPTILKVASPGDDGPDSQLSANWKVMFEQRRVFVKQLSEHIRLETEEAADDGCLTPENYPMYRWCIHNTESLFLYSDYIGSPTFNHCMKSNENTLVRSNFQEVVIPVPSANQMLHDRIQSVTHPLADTLDPSKWEQALDIINQFKASPSLDKWEWEFNQSCELIKLQHAKTASTLPGFHLRKGVRPGAAWLSELFSGVENGMLSNALHSAVATVTAVLYGSITIMEREQPNFYGNGSAAAGKSRAVEHVMDCSTEGICKVMSHESAHAIIRNCPQGCSIYNEGAAFLSSIGGKDTQAKKFMKNNYGSARTSTAARYNAQTGSVDKDTTTNLSTMISLQNDPMNAEHEENKAIYSRGILFNFDNIVKNSKSAPTQQLGISERDSLHKHLYAAYREQSKLRVNIWNYYDSMRHFLKAPSSPDVLCWTFEFLKKIKFAGSAMINARVTNHVRLFMDIYQTHLCVTSVYTGLDVPTKEVYHSLVSEANLSTQDLDRLAEAWISGEQEGAYEGCSAKFLILWEMVRTMKVPQAEFLRRVGSFFDLMTKECLMFGGLDACAAAIGLVTGPQQNEAHLIRSLKEYLYSIDYAIDVYDDKPEYIKIEKTPDLFAEDFSKHRCMSGEFRDKAWAQDLLNTWQRRQIDNLGVVVCISDTVLILKSFLSEVLTEKEKETIISMEKGAFGLDEGSRAINLRTYGASERNFPRNAFCLLAFGNAYYPPDFNVERCGTAVEFLFCPDSAKKAFKSIAAHTMCKMNTSLVCHPVMTHFLVSRDAIQMAHQSDTNNSDFSRGIKRVLGEFYASPETKGKICITVPEKTNEFPLLEAPPIARFRTEDLTRINPIYVSEKDRKSMGKCAYNRLTKKHITPKLRLSKGIDNEDECATAHFKTCKLYRLCQRDGDGAWALSLYQKLLSPTAMQKNNDRLVRESLESPQ